MDYEEAELEELESIVQDGVALIVTATDIETKVTHENLTPINGYSKILQVYYDASTYYFGLLGKYHIAHVQSNMGSIGRSSAIMTISNAIRIIKPKFVLMIGIAFGVEKGKQHIGDVLISEGIIPYSVKRVGESTIQRGQNAPSSKILVDRFKSIKTWQHILPDSKNASRIFTQVLSGEELIDNIVRRDDLVKEFPYSKGGEMEGAGLFAACDSIVDWILVKGICDFADGNKDNNKEINQQIAIESAISLCQELFNSKHAFNFYNYNPVSSEVKIEFSGICNCEKADEILFEIYNSSNEPYYIIRKEDDSFINILSQYCVWIHGVSGCGKSNLILRNLITKKYNYLQITLASCISLNVIELFTEIQFDLENKFGSIDNPLEKKTFSNISRNILCLLEKYCSDKEYVIFIEEIPISSTEDYKQFVSHFFSLLISKKLKFGLNKVKFVLSSLKNPANHIQENQLKIHQQVRFIEIENWDNEDIDKLIQLICTELKIKFSDVFMQKLKSISNNSPRFVKKFFKNILACCVNTENEYEIILAETERELKQYYHG